MIPPFTGGSHAQQHRLTVVAAFLALASCAHAQNANALWYDKPATDWEKEALPIGNGRIGAMVFGGVDSERLQISEKSLWTGGPGAEGGYDFGLPADSQAGAHALASANNCSTARTLEPEDVAKQLGRKMHNYGDYQSFGDLIIERETDGTPVSDYRRELDLDTAIARVSFKQGGAGYRREYFVSYPDQVAGRALVRHQRAEAAREIRGARQSQRAGARRGRRASRSRARSSRTASSTRPRCACRRIAAACAADGDSLRVDSECAVTFVLAARTNYQMRYPGLSRCDVDPAAQAAKDASAADQGRYATRATPPHAGPPGAVPPRGARARCGQAPKHVHRQAARAIRQRQRGGRPRSSSSSISSTAAIC